MSERSCNAAAQPVCPLMGGRTFTNVWQGK